MMSPDVETPSLTSVVVRALETWVPFADARRSSRRRVLRWCRRHGFELLRWRVAKLLEGPSSWDAHQRHYRIQIVDAAGRRRAAYLTFARTFVFERCVEVLWDDPNGRPVPEAPDAPQADDGETSGLVPVASLPR
jgi:hypothetical protein